MWALPATLLLLPIAHLCSDTCSSSNHHIISGKLDLTALNISSCTCVNVSSQGITELQGKPWQQLKELDLSHNRLQKLPKEFLDNLLDLESLYLNDNELKQFTSNVFSKSCKLKVLRLEGNQLTSLPTNDFPKSLTSLSVDCKCELANITRLRSADNSTIECQDQSAPGLSNARDFYTEKCVNKPVKSIAIAIVATILGVLLAAGVAYFLIRRKKRGAAFGQDKRASNASDATHGQPRYLTHSGPQDLDRDTGHHANYENVFIDQAQEARGGSGDHRGQRQPKSRLPSSVEKANNSLSDQPIYANTQDVYYNYQGQTASEAPDEEVYIMPDQ